MSNEITNYFIKKYIKYKVKFLKAGSTEVEQKLYINTNFIVDTIDLERTLHNSKGKNLLPYRHPYYTVVISNNRPLDSYFYSIEINNFEISLEELQSGFSKIYNRVNEQKEEDITTKGKADLTVYDLIKTFKTWDTSSLSPRPNLVIKLEDIAIGYLDNPENKLDSFYTNVDKALRLKDGQKFYLTA
jgi:hypothetical protein